jgi:hypothetical protein
MGNIDWMPIEGAPKDGTTVLLWCPVIQGWVRPNAMDQNIAIGHWTGHFWQGCDGDIDRGYESSGPIFEHEAYQPTHWAEINPPSADPGIPVYRMKDATEQLRNEIPSNPIPGYRHDVLGKDGE